MLRSGLRTGWQSVRSRTYGGAAATPQPRIGTALAQSRFVAAESRQGDIYSATSELADELAHKLGGATPQFVYLVSNASAPKLRTKRLREHLHERWPGAALVGMVQPSGDRRHGDGGPLTTILAATLSAECSAFSFHCAEPTLPPFLNEMLRTGGGDPMQVSRAEPGLFGFACFELASLRTVAVA